MSTELETFYQMVADIEVAMMTTRRADGHLRSRAMATQKRASGVDFRLWGGGVDTGPAEDCRALLVGLEDVVRRRQGPAPRHTRRPTHRPHWRDDASVEFLEVNKSKPVIMYELVKGWLTGSEPDLGTMHQLNKTDPTF